MPTRLAFTIFVMLLAAVLALAPSRARAADPIKDLNGSLQVSGTKDATALLFPVLAAMTDAPKAPATLRGVSLLSGTSPRFAEWSAWAKAEAQQKAIEALKTVTDPAAKYALWLPYGREGVDPAWVSAGLFVELVGKDPLLASAPRGLRYLDRLETLCVLCSVEAERLALEAKPQESSGVLLAWLRLGRMIADRPFAAEKAWGMQHMISALERLADIACTHPTLMDEKTVKDVSKDLDARAILVDRIRFPRGERAAIEQLLALTMEERGGPRSEAFGPTMGQVTAASQNPLDLFPESAYWDLIAASHAGRFDTTDKANAVLDDWEKRWNLNNIFDPLMDTPTDYEGMDRLKFALVEQVVKDLPQLFNLRTLVSTYLGGVRSAYGVVGFKSVQGQWPPTLPAVQPRFVQALDNDPWFFEESREVRDIYHYFVPIRDQPRGPRDLPKPHEVVVDLSGLGSTGGSGAGGGAQVPDIVSQTFDGWAIDLLRGKAGELYDAGAGKVDVAKLPEVWKSLLEERTKQRRGELRDALKTVSPEERAMLLQVFAALQNATPESVGGMMDGLLSLPPMVEAARRGAERFGLTFDEAKQFLIAVNTEMARLPEFTAAIKSLAQGEVPEDASVAKEIDGMIEVLTAPAIVENYVSKMLAHAVSGAASAGDPASDAGGTLAAALTEADFVLYSVGPDQKRGWARSVGPMGPDILIWPSVLTLERRRLAGN